jgi:hypothetical protein
MFKEEHITHSASLRCGRKHLSHVLNEGTQKFFESINDGLEIELELDGKPFSHSDLEQCYKFDLDCKPIIKKITGKYSSVLLEWDYRYEITWKLPGTLQKQLVYYPQFNFTKHIPKACQTTKNLVNMKLSSSNKPTKYLCEYVGEAPEDHVTCSPRAVKDKYIIDLETKGLVAGFYINVRQPIYLEEKNKKLLVTNSRHCYITKVLLLHNGVPVQYYINDGHPLQTPFYTLEKPVNTSSFSKWQIKFDLNSVVERPPKVSLSVYDSIKVLDTVDYTKHVLEVRAKSTKLAGCLECGGKKCTLVQKKKNDPKLIKANRKELKFDLRKCRVNDYVNDYEEKEFECDGSDTELEEFSRWEYDALDELPELVREVVELPESVIETTPEITPEENTLDDFEKIDVGSVLTNELTNELTSEEPKSSFWTWAFF